MKKVHTHTHRWNDLQYSNHYVGINGWH
jgi:hypothetical protein